MFGPSAVVRRQAQHPPSAVMTATELRAPWYQDAGVRKLMFPILLIYLTQVCTGFDATLTANLQSFAEWKREMGSPTSSQLGLITAIYFIGCLAGSLPAVWVTDKFGRRIGLVTGQILTITGAGFQAGSHGRGQYMGSRLILGFGIAFVTCAGPALLSELAPPKVRGTLVSFFNPFWYLGSIIVAWTCFGTSHMDPTNTWNWRIPSLLQAVIPCFVLSCAYWIPESPRWLISKGRAQEAIDILAKYHGSGDPEDEVVVTEVAEIRDAIEKAREGIAWRALFTKVNIHRLLIVICMTLMTLWCGQNIITFYFSTILSGIGITATTSQTGINGGLNIANLISSVVGALLTDRLGRRKLWMMSYMGMITIFVPFIALSALYQEKSNINLGYGVVVCLFLFDIMYNVACNPLLYSYTTEIMPFFMRSKGLGIKNLVGQVALITNQYVNPIALVAITWKYYLVFLVLNCMWLFLIWYFFPETKGYSLEELALLFDGDSDTVLVGIDAAKKIAEVEETGAEGKISV